MPSLRSSGKIAGKSVSIRQLAQEHNLSPPLSVRELIEALGIRGSPEIPFRYGTHNLPGRGSQIRREFPRRRAGLGDFQRQVLRG